MTWKGLDKKAATSELNYMKNWIYQATQVAYTVLTLTQVPEVGFGRFYSPCKKYEIIFNLEVV